MKKFIIKSLLIIISVSSFIFVNTSINTVHAQKDQRGDYGSNPISILDEVVSKANNDRAYAVQDTALDNINAWPGRHRIYQTLQRIRKNISPYLQRAVYIGLTTAVILLIYNGLLMVTTWIHDSGKFESIKKNLVNIMIWVLLLTWFYIIFKLIIAAINALFWQT